MGKQTKTGYLFVFAQEGSRSAPPAQRAEATEECMKPICALLLAALGLTFGTPGEAQTWPAKSLRAIVPTEAGSIADLVPRVVFEQLSRQLGQTIVVENRTGAGGT